jgi:hypothetical protein
VTSLAPADLGRAGPSGYLRFSFKQRCKTSHVSMIPPGNGLPAATGFSGINFDGNPLDFSTHPTNSQLPQLDGIEDCFIYDSRFDNFLPTNDQLPNYNNAIPTFNTFSPATSLLPELHPSLHLPNFGVRTENMISGLATNCQLPAVCS